MNKAYEYHATNKAKTIAVLNHLQSVGIPVLQFSSFSGKTIEDLAKYIIAKFPFMAIYADRSYLHLAGNCASTHTPLTFEQVFEVIKVKKEIPVKLNAEYTALVTEDGVKVGCQTFTKQAVVALYNAVIEIDK